MVEGQSGWVFFNKVEILNAPSPSGRGKGSRGGQPEGWCPGCQRAAFPACNVQITVTTVSTLPVFTEGRNGFVLWLLTPLHDHGWLCFFSTNTRQTSGDSVHLHAIHTLLRKKMIGNFIRHPFNSFNSSVNRQLPLLGNCLTHFLPEQPAGFALQYFLFTFSTSPDIIPFLAEADC